ncbi:neurofilament medium polypeptide [Drosophila takahashii]|uniref:neurofilament medium polypeptide n=1 Tax=Drosophila takahashii TaxID=29030 RepID=UPI001CF81197|nr:transcriptional regulator ATRX homolog [Drosophila takahashii]
MDWQLTILAGLICLLLPTQFNLAKAWSLPSRHTNQLALASQTPVGRRLNEVSPYLDLALCPIRAEPWTCARQQSGRILDAWDGELHVQWQKLKVEADRQMNATIEKRGYSTSELPVKEKPSTILKKIEIGTNYMKKYLAESMDGFLGREYEYLQTPKAADDNDSETDQSGNSVEDDNDDEADAADDASNAAEEEENADDEDANNEEEDEDDDDRDEGDEEDDDSDSTGENEEQEPEAETEDEDVDEAVSAPESENEKENTPSVFSGTPAAQPQSDGKNPVFNEDNTSTGVEFIELEDAEENAAGALKKPGGGKRKKNKKGGKRKKNKKKGQGQETQPATLVVVQQAPEHHEVDSGHESGSSVISHDDHEDNESLGKPMKKRKQKRRMKGKRKRKGQHGSTSSVAEHEQSDLSLGLGLLDELADADDVFSGVGGGKRKHRNPLNYGRSNGVTRGKKKKKKKAIAKFIMIGSFLKAKIELLLKILGAHLQVKFFAIALIGLLINIARFWIDVKRGSPPSKVVYVEHAHHQHHYEDHGDDWSEPGSYWKRSLQTPDPSAEDVDSSTDSYQVRQPGQQQSQFQDPHYLAYRNQWQ